MIHDRGRASEVRSSVPNGVILPKPEWVMIVALLAVAWFAPRLGERWLTEVENAASRLAIRRGAAILGVALLAIALRLLLLPLIPVPVPGIHDEFSYLLQADTFAHGRLANPPHPLWQSFETFHVNWFPTYSSMYPPGQALVLAIGQFLGHPWIGVLLSVAAMCAAITWMLQAWMPPRWALLGGCFAALKLSTLSYWVNSYWGGAATAIGGALVLGALPRIFRKWRTGDALLLGTGLAILAITRPFEGLILGAPAGAWFLVRLLGWRSPPLRAALPRVVAPIVLALLLTASFIAYYNWRLTGNPLLLPHTLNTRNYQTTPLFLWQHPKAPLHYNNRQLEVFYNIWTRNYFGNGTWEDFKRMTYDKVERFWEVFLWPGCVPALLCFPFVFRDRRTCFLILEFTVCALGLVAVVWSMPHYAAPATCVTYALVLQGLRHLRTFRFAGRPVGLGLSRVVLLTLLMTIALGLRGRVLHPYAWGWNENMGNWRRAGVARHLEHTPGNHLVLVRYDRIHNIHEEWVYNAADIDASKVVWARELDPERNRKLLAYYKDRQAWLVNADEPAPALQPYTPPSNRFLPAP